MGKKTKELPSWYPLHTGLQKTTLFRASSLASCSSSWFVFPSHWLHFGCFPTSSGAYFPFDRLKNDWEEPVREPLLKGTTQAFFHFTTISHRVIKRRTDDSIHSWSSASKVESRWHHWRCELVPAVFLDHLGLCNKDNKQQYLKKTQTWGKNEVVSRREVLFTVHTTELVLDCPKVSPF